MTDVTTGSVTAKDGTTLGYRRLGHGPGLLVVHGTMESAQSHLQLAEALADTFTVYLPDRRGRGLSGPYGGDYRISDDVDDLDALLTATGAENVFAVSAGAIVALRAALSLPALGRLAIYEPPLFPDRSVPIAVATRFDEEMAQGRLAAALVTAMKGAQMGPRVFTVLPRWLLERLTTMAMAGEDRNATGDAVTMRMLAPTLPYDFRLIAELSGQAAGFRAIRDEVLLLGGSRSPAYLRAALDDLERVMPNTKRIEFPGLNHGGSGNRNRGGKPERVARELRRFLA